jgi:hypothetical protein
LFTGKTEKYRIFPKKAKIRKIPEEKQKRDDSQPKAEKSIPLRIF